MGEYIDKLKQKFEWYRLTLPNNHRAIFEKIIGCIEAHEGSFRNMPNRSTEVLLMNYLIDMEERLRRLEEKRMG